VVRSFSYTLNPRPRIVGYGVAIDGVPCLAEAEQFQPGLLEAETVALPARLLPMVWDSVWTPSFPAVVFTGPGYGTLTEADRDLIWRRWGVPVYEHRLTSSGELLAEECDAHDRLHVRPGFNLSGDTEYVRCACGYKGPVLSGRTLQEDACAPNAG
jgi:hypothetical protein